MYLADFAAKPEESRLAINRLISKQTNNRITGLFPAGSIMELTRVVLTNAVYFYSEWEYCFGEYTCGDAVFELPDGHQVSAPLMSMSTLEDSTIKINYTSGENYEAVELPYKGKQVSMVVVLPSPECYRQVESTFENDRYNRILENFSPEEVVVTLPKFSVTRSVELKPVLNLLGMHAPFDETADFSGINGNADLYISDVFHKACVSVDEKGTEATAASGISFMEKGGPKYFCANRPFIFIIRETKTNTILFIGRVMNPVG
jgi:serpin B